MATESHAPRPLAGQPQQAAQSHAPQPMAPTPQVGQPMDKPDRMEKPDRHPKGATFPLALTTREKCLVETAYDVVFEVEDGKAVVVSMVDGMHAYVVAADTPGRAMVSVTPVVPHEDYVPACIVCEVTYPLAEVVLGVPEPK